MKLDFLYKFASSAGKKYARGSAVVFTGVNIIDFYQNGYMQGWRNMGGKIVVSAGWPVMLPLMAIISGCPTDKQCTYSVIGLWAALLILP